MASDDLNLPELEPNPPAQPGAEAAVPAVPNEAEDREKFAADLEPVFDVPVSIQAVIGKTSLEIAELMQLGPGSVLELDRRVGEAIDIFVNSRLVARGEIVVVDDRLGVTMTEIIKNTGG
ncbi:MAG: flagellar motor switch protein FliN [Pseudomonadota bacterium]